MPALFAIPPIQSFLPLQSVQTAVEAYAIVTAYHSTAFGTSPSSFLRSEEGLHAFVPDAVQVLDLAHSEIGLVASVYRREGFTGEVAAFEAILHLVLEEKIALLLEEGTWRLSRPAAIAVPHPYA